MSTVEISVDDAAGLRAMDADVVDKFNLFDIRLKDAYGGRIIDLIDYEAGVVRVVTCTAAAEPIEMDS